MTQRKLFKEADLARALRVAKAAGLDVERFTIDPAGGIMVASRSSPQDDYGPEAARAALDDLGRWIDARRQKRAQRSAPRAHQAAG